MSLYAPFRPDLKHQEPLVIEDAPAAKLPVPTMAAAAATATATSEGQGNPGSKAGPTAPSDLPEPGKLDRPAVKQGDEVFAVQGDMLAEWQKGTVMEEVQQGQDINYKVRIPRYNASGVCITAHHKTAGPRSVAYFAPATVRLQVGTRVIGLYREPESLDAGGYYSGIVAEPPKAMNKYRYLVFFDDGYAR